MTYEPKSIREEDHGPPVIVVPEASSVRSGSATLRGVTQYLVSVKLFMESGSDIIVYLDPLHAFEVGSDLVRRAGVDVPIPPIPK